MIQPTPVESPRSTAYKYKPKTKDVRMTTIVVAQTSRRVGQVTRPSSPRTSPRNRRPRAIQLPRSVDSFKLSKETTFIFYSLLAGPTPLAPPCGARRLALLGRTPLAVLAGQE